MASADDEIERMNEGWRLLGRDVQVELIARGWAVADLNVSDDTPLEFFWPPTAPFGYGGLPKWSHVGQETENYRARPTPWVSPTRITQVGSAWRVDYGEAIAQAPDAPIEHTDDHALLNDLPRIEWWPMPVAEARRIQNQRVLHTTHADAYDQHSLGYRIETEPYESRLREVYDQIRSETPITMGDPDAWKWAGDLHARMRIIDGEMWASAVRTARAGGEGWDTSGPKRVPDENEENP
jgi:hypothetical protein